MTTTRKQTAFRFSEELIERLKVQAEKEHRSLNNYVEKILMEIAFSTPNDVTLSAMKEAKEGNNLETLDLNHFDEFVESL